MDSADSPGTRGESEKMLAGELYNPNDSKLKQLRNRARGLQRQYNQTTDEQKDTREAILKEWLGSKGAEVYIEPPFTCDYGSNLYMGEWTYMNFDCMVLDTCRVDIGSHVKFGPKVQIYTATHPLDATQRTTPPFLENGRPIKIGNNVWIGGGAIICPGVTIGDNSTIGAGAVVTKSVPANVLAAGNPARVIRELAPPP
jgi:maltose O-acetyltransferase